MKNFSKKFDKWMNVFMIVVFVAAGIFFSRDIFLGFFHAPLFVTSVEISLVALSFKIVHYIYKDFK